MVATAGFYDRSEASVTTSCSTSGGRQTKGLLWAKRRRTIRIQRRRKYSGPFEIDSSVERGPIVSPVGDLVVYGGVPPM